MPHPSVIALWKRYRSLQPMVPVEPPHAEYFCDNKEDADRCASLVLAGRKRAIASALVGYEMAGALLPHPGLFLIVTDWAGEAKALIQTRHVIVRRFGAVPASFAYLEGEGDGTLEWWRDAHRAFWTRTFVETIEEINDEFQVVCEEFDLALIA